MKGKYYTKAEGKATWHSMLRLMPINNHVKSLQESIHQNKLINQYEKIIELDYKMLFKSPLEVFPLKKYPEGMVRIIVK